MDLINIACYIGGCESIVIMVKKFDNDNEVSYGVMNLICKCFFFFWQTMIYIEREKKYDIALCKSIYIIWHSRLL